MRFDSRSLNFSFSYWSHKADDLAHVTHGLIEVVPATLASLLRLILK